MLALRLAFAAVLIASAAAMPPTVPQITRPADATPTTVYQYEGFIADWFCVNQRWALDAADMWRQPQQHTLHCLVDITRCYQSGFCLMQAGPDSSDYGCAYSFTQNETLAMRDHFMLDRMERSNLHVRFNATWLNASQMNVDIRSVAFTSPPADFTPIVATIVIGVVITLCMVVLGGVFNCMGVRLSGGRLALAQLCVVGTQLLLTLAIIIVATVTYVDAKLAAPFARGTGVAISYLFMLVLLPTTKHFGVGYLIGASCEQFFKFHVITGLVLWLVMSMHGISMFIAFGDVEPNGAFLFRFSGTKRANGAGFVAWMLTTVMLVTGLLRFKFYTLFRMAHYLFVLVLVFSLIHNPVGAILYAIPLILVIIDFIIRWVKTCRTSPAVVSAKHVAAARVTMLELQLANGISFQAGQHVQLRVWGASAVAQHPFTLAWYDEATRRAKFFIRNTAPGTWTNKVAVCADSGALGTVSWTGPLGFVYVPLQSLSHIVVVAGGIGVTFLTNVLCALSAPLRAPREGTPSSFQAVFPRLQRVTLLWSVREVELVHAVADVMNEALTAIKGFVEGGKADIAVDVQIYVTATDRDEQPDVPPPPPPPELPLTKVHSGRPNIPAVLDSCGLRLTEPKLTCVYACGPAAVVRKAGEAAASAGVLFDEQAFSIGPAPPAKNASSSPVSQRESPLLNVSPAQQQPQQEQADRYSLLFDEQAFSTGPAPPAKNAPSSPVSQRESPLLNVSAAQQQPQQEQADRYSLL